MRGIDIDLAKLVAMCKSEDWATSEWPVEIFQLTNSNTPHSLILTHLAWGGIFFLVPYMTDALHLLDEWQEILLLCCD